MTGERWGRRHTFGSPLSSSADLRTAKTTVYQCLSNQSFLGDGEVGESMIIEIIIVISHFYVVIIQMYYNILITDIYHCPFNKI